MSGEARQGTETSAMMLWTAIGVIITLVSAFVMGLCSVMSETSE